LRDDVGVDEREELAAGLARSEVARAAGECPLRPLDEPNPREVAADSTGRPVAGAVDDHDLPASFPHLRLERREDSRQRAGCAIARDHDGEARPACSGRLGAPRSCGYGRRMPAHDAMVVLGRRGGLGLASGGVPASV